MNVLRSLESTIAGLVEGTFGRLFASEVRPMEIAHKLVREMDANRWTSVSRVYAPNEYAVWLSTEDRTRYEGIEDDVIDELCAYLLEHARREQLMLAAAPSVVFHTDPELALGEFGIEARMTSPGEAPVQARGAQQLPDHGQTMIYSTSERVRGPVQEAQARRTARALLVLGSKRLLIEPGGAVLGRSRDCDVMIDDAGASRRHAEIRPAAHGWEIADLRSTNGTRVNGRALDDIHPLAPGDRIEIGSTEISFEVR